MHALFAEFDTPEAIVEAARGLRARGFSRLEAFTPFAVLDLEAPLGVRRSRIPALFLAGGLVGGLTAYVVQWWTAAISYPLNVGGRPLHSAPAFIPITFELTVLGAALTGFVALLVKTGLPRPYHPVFEIEGFDRASVDRFWLAVEASDPRFDESVVRREFEGHGALRIVDTGGEP